MSRPTYTGTLSPNADAASTWNTITNATSSGSSNVADLVDDASAYDANQEIFKNQPLSWWLEGMLSGVVFYTPISNTVNWSYNSFQIDRALTDVIIPNRTDSSVRDQNSMTLNLKDNNCLLLKCTRTMPGPRPQPQPAPAPAPPV